MTETVTLGGIFTELFGPYPYATLDLVEVPGVIGYEFPQLIFLGADYYPDPAASGSRPGALPLEASSGAGRGVLLGLAEKG